MNLYAESSAVLRWLLGADPAGRVAATLETAERVFASRVGLVEIERVLFRRAREGTMSEAQANEARRLLEATLPRWNVIELTAEIAQRASQPFPIEPVRTLDALHLSAALFASRLAPDLGVLSTDTRILSNAERLGLAVALTA